MRTSPSPTSPIAELDPEMLAIVEAFAAAIVRIKAHDDEKKVAAEQAAKLALANVKPVPVKPAHGANEDQTRQSPAPKLLRIADVGERLSMSRGTIYRKIKDGTFPPPKKLGHSVRWMAADIEAWVDGLS